MSMNKRHRQFGFTLIEVIIFIVVLAAGLAGILTVSNTVVKSSGDPMVRKQAIALADSILEEVLLQAYCDQDLVNPPSTPPACGAHVVKPAGAGARSTFDNVDDYGGRSAADIATLFADSLVHVPGYTISITVAPATVADSAALSALPQPAKKVTVTVSRSTDSVAMTGYRANY